MNKSSDIGLIGLAVMGENLVLNMANHGFRVSVFNRTSERVDKFLNGGAKGKSIVGFHSIEEFVASLERPRKVMMMVKAGSPVDDLIEQLIPLLEPGDVIIDGGNSHYPDTNRRTTYIESKGLLFIGTGVSGGEEGALKGPSIMPGGSKAAWPLVKPIFQTIAAKVEGGTPCCEWVGENGAGHFVKMVHNGIEYGDMQLICEVYQLMKERLHLSPNEMSQVFAEWNQGELDSYLIEITADILKFKNEDGLPLVDLILDAAGQKGTGQWTGKAALELGVPLTLITESVFSRSLSAMKEERVLASKVYTENALPSPVSGASAGEGPGVRSITGPQELRQGPGMRSVSTLEELRLALYASKIISYSQGYMLMQSAAREYGWNLNYGGIALMWRGGCIIRSAFLGKIKEAYDRNPNLANLLMDPFFKEQIEKAQTAWRKVISDAVLNGIPVPALSAALSFFDGYRSKWLPANLLQAQRDYFGAHTYERIDRPRGDFFHTQWY
jgi:6-phosphogluconate dehydrogenase